MGKPWENGGLVGFNGIFHSESGVRDLLGKSLICLLDMLDMLDVINDKTLIIHHDKG